MNSVHLFKMALGLEEPWEVKSIQFKESASGQELHIDIDFKRGSKFPDEEGNFCEVHDTKQKTWRHLNFGVVQSRVTFLYLKISYKPYGCWLQGVFAI